jgi:hypothetical protein
MDESGLLVFLFNCYWFEVFGFEDLPAIQTFDVLDAIASGDYLCLGVLTSVLHKARLTIYSNEADAGVKGATANFFPTGNMFGIL